MYPLLQSTNTQHSTIFYFRIWISIEYGNEMPFVNPNGKDGLPDRSRTCIFSLWKPFTVALDIHKNCECSTLSYRESRSRYRIQYNPQRTHVRREPHMLNFRTFLNKHPNSSVRNTECGRLRTGRGNMRIHNLTNLINCDLQKSASRLRLSAFSALQ